MDEKAYWIAFNRVPGIGPARLATLLELCGSIQAAWEAPLSTLRQAGLDRRSLENLLALRRQMDPQAELERVRQAGVQVLTWGDPGYPPYLRQIPHPPPVLYIQGELTPQDEMAVALVGTRRASAYGRQVAETLARELAHHRVTVVSGLALGIDTVAHQAALEAGGRTLAVLGSGVDQIYPARNRGLALRVAAQGALISEYPLGTRPEAANFPPRNRIISGLSLAVVVVEAGERSGARITAEFAADQGREVFAVPGSIFSPSSVGCNRLIQQGAYPLLSPEELLEQLRVDRRTAQQQARELIPPEPDEANLLAHLDQEPRHVDELVRAAALSPAEVNSLLTVMELKGLVRQVGPLQYVRAEAAP